MVFNDLRHPLYIIVFKNRGSFLHIFSKNDMLFVGQIIFFTRHVWLGGGQCKLQRAD